ncbi:MAG: xanthine/uracil/vitamin C permease [Candidatus Eremiobacteraeota bacterium]|nr:xanthine/uracil/vitamin C permease [Candidatus Eremiobacteraeota bacterium]
MGRLWKSSDWNGFWALLADNLANLVIAAGVCKGVFNMPDEIVFGRILPGLGVSLVAGLSFYAYQGYKLGQKENREDVTALPYGISTPVLFIYLFGVLAPLYFGWLDQYGDQAALMAWQAGVAACFMGGAVECLGSLFGPTLKRITPRAGMLGTLAGIALVYIATVPLASILEHPLVGLPALGIVLAGLIAGLRLPFGLPAGLVAIVLGSAIGLATGAATIDTTWRPSLHVPLPVVGDIIQGFQLLLSKPEILAVVLPIEIYNFIETMNNVESAEAAGDAYPVRTCQVADGAGTMIGALFGSTFPTTVYIGHPAYKRLGSRLGYAAAVGLVSLFVAVTGLHAFFYKLIPTSAVAPLLVFVGTVIVGQAFSESPRRHGVAVAFAMLCHVSNLLVTNINGVLQVHDLPNDEALLSKLAGQGIHWAGHQTMALGAIVSGLIWGAIVAYLIDHKVARAAGFAFAGGLLTLFGVIHGPTLGFYPNSIALGYALLGGVILLFSGAESVLEDTAQS